MRDSFTTESPNIPLRYVALRRMSMMRFCSLRCVKPYTKYLESHIDMDDNCFSSTEDQFGFQK